MAGESIVSGRHIALVVPGFPANEADTTCVPAVQLYAKQLSERGAKITVFALHYPYMSDSYSWKGISVYPLNGRNSRLKRYLTLYGTLRRSFAEVHKTHPVDLIHTMWLQDATAFGIRLGKTWGIPVIATAHGQDVLPENHFLPRIKRSGIPVYCLSAFQRSILLRAGWKDIHMIPWGVEEAATRQIRTVDLVSVGSLIPLKRHEYFLQVCAGVKAKQGKIQAVIVGEGPERRRLETLRRQYGLEDEVQMPGALSRAETLDLIADSSVMVHPSRFEGFGLVMAEALAAGVRVAALPVGLAADQTDIELLTNDPNKDTARVLQLLNEPFPAALCLDIRHTVNAYEQVYATFLPGRKRT